uniref:Uncharacterized protein n=1 Tax=Arundo donax TaxID=35708 RepID=A0A0A8YVJ1_ARUDO
MSKYDATSFDTVFLHHGAKYFGTMLGGLYPRAPSCPIASLLFPPSQARLQQRELPHLLSMFPLQIHQI